VKVISPTAPAVANANITNSRPIALAPSTAAKSAGGVSVGAMTIASNTPATGPTGGIIRNPLGRLGR
jgi:hypothetical protein